MTGGWTERRRAHRGRRRRRLGTQTLGGGIDINKSRLRPARALEQMDDYVCHTTSSGTGRPGDRVTMKPPAPGPGLRDLPGSQAHRPARGTLRGHRQRRSWPDMPELIEHLHYGSWTSLRKELAKRWYPGPSSTRRRRWRPSCVGGHPGIHRRAATAGLTPPGEAELSGSQGRG